MANTVPNTIAVREVGDRIRWRVTMSPAADVSAWALGLEVCDYDPPTAWPPAATVEDAAAGVFYFTFDTAAWRADLYHFRAWRTAPDPGVVAHLYLTLRTCCG